MGLQVLGVLLILGLVQGIPEVIPSEATNAENIRNNANSRIVSGWVAQDGQFPYQASLRMVSAVGGVGACGGSVLHNKWILTAAHCLARRVTFVVRLGLTNLTRTDYIVESTLSHIHEGYNQASTAVQSDDIGLLELVKEIPYGRFIQPIRLQTSQKKSVEYGGEVLTLSGHGRVNDLWLGGYVPEILYWVYQRGITMAQCWTWYPNSQTLNVQHMCVQYFNDTSQSGCTGDSGSPLTLVDWDGEITQVGLMSFGAAIGCNAPNPTGFIRPEYYHDWIEARTGISFDWDIPGVAGNSEADSPDLIAKEGSPIIVVDN